MRYVPGPMDMNGHPPQNNNGSLQYIQRLREGAKEWRDKIHEYMRDIALRSCAACSDGREVESCAMPSRSQEHGIYGIVCHRGAVNQCLSDFTVLEICARITE